MLAAILTMALFTPFTIGHVTPAGNEPATAAYVQSGSHFQEWLPPRTIVADMSQCNWLFRAHVDGRKGRWNSAHDVIHFGPVAFDGMSFFNTSYNRPANVYATIRNVC